MSELAAFPSSIRPAAEKVTAALIAPPLGHSGHFTVSVEAEILEIPVRIYNPPLPEETTSAWGQVEQNVYACLFTRHHDGYIRQRHLRTLVGLSQSWVAPFVVRLIGEYVIEIIEDILKGLYDIEEPGTAHRTQYATFAAANPVFIELTAARVASYWACYHRHDYPRLGDYPGFQLISSLRRIVA